MIIIITIKTTASSSSLKLFTLVQIRALGVIGGFSNPSSAYFVFFFFLVQTSSI